MENNSKKINELKTEVGNLRGMWMNAVCEAETLRCELELYKKLCKAQSEIIHRDTSGGVKD